MHTVENPSATPTTRSPTRTGSAIRSWPWALVDVVAVLVFTVVGRVSHAESLLDPAATLRVVVPVLVGLGVAWAIVAATPRLRATPRRVRWTGGVVWAVTLGVGLALRPVFGGGLPVPFVVVTAITLAIFLLGWRGIVAAVRAARQRS